jgi:hypothetical protein
MNNDRTKPSRVLGGLKKYLNILYSLATLIALFLTLYFFWEPLKKEFQPAYKTFRDETFIRGILLPNNLDITNKIIFEFGTNQNIIRVKDIQSGVRISQDFMACDTFKLGITEEAGLVFKKIGNRLYCSIDFIDLNSGNTVGEMNYNKWQLKINNTYNFYNDDAKLEIYDYNKIIMFSMQFVWPNVIKIKGYFINKKFAVVIGEKGPSPCIFKADSDWREDVISEAIRLGLKQ